MNLSKKLIIILIIPLLAFTLHKYYISLTKIEYVKEEKSIQITMRFFIDDIEKTLLNRYNIPLELATDQENKKSDFYLEKYIRQKFILKINDTINQANYLGKEYDNDVVFFYLEITNIENIKTLEVQNSMLFEEFFDQENYIKLIVNDVKKIYILRNENDKKLLKF